MQYSLIGAGYVNCLGKPVFCKKEDGYCVHLQDLKPQVTGPLSQNWTCNYNFIVSQVAVLLEVVNMETIQTQVSWLYCINAVYVYQPILYLVAPNFKLGRIHRFRQAAKYKLYTYLKV